MRKILVIGSGGSGKSTFAKKLSKLLDIECVHLDRLYWQAGWVATPDAEWRATLAQILARDGWIMDGNYSGTLALRMAACDTVVFLDMPRSVCLWRVVKRLVKYWRQPRPDMAAGCQERLNIEFLKWVWDYPNRSRHKIVELLKEHSSSKQIVWLRTQAEADCFLDQLAAQTERINKKIFSDDRW